MATRKKTQPTENKEIDYTAGREACEEVLNIPNPSGTGKKDATPDYQKRVAVELDDLTEKIEKLAAFLNSPDAADVPPLYDRGLMVKQLDLMRRYKLILEARLAQF